MCHKVITSAPLRLNTWDTTDAFHPIAPWMPALDLAKWTFDLMLSARVGNFRARPGYQLAAIRPDVAADPVAIGTATTTEGWTQFTTTAVAMDAQFFWRPGIMYSTSTAGAYASADVQLEAQLLSFFELAGNRSLVVLPMDTASVPAILPITDWLPTVGWKYLKSAIVIANRLNGMQTRLFVRWANDKAAPGADWSAADGGWETISNENYSYNTGTSVVTPSGAWGQVGLGVQQTTGSANRATIDVATIIGRG